MILSLSYMYQYTEIAFSFAVLTQYSGHLFILKKYSRHVDVIIETVVARYVIIDKVVVICHH